MREIKFKTYDNISNMWCFLDLQLIHTAKFDWKEYKNWCQYTGLKDKNEKEIYEGDIVRTDYDGRFEKTFVVKSPAWFECDAFDVFGYEGFGTFSEENHGMESCEVIGNIYENPELLKP